MRSINELQNKSGFKLSTLSFPHFAMRFSTVFDDLIVNLILDQFFTFLYWSVTHTAFWASRMHCILSSVYDCSYFHCNARSCFNWLPAVHSPVSLIRFYISAPYTYVWFINMDICWIMISDDLGIMRFILMDWLIITSYILIPDSLLIWFLMLPE